MKGKEVIQLAAVAALIYINRKECGGYICAVARTLNIRPLDILGTALARL